MSAQTAVHPFLFKKENAIWLEKHYLAINAQLKNIKLESGQEDAFIKLIVQVPSHAALKCVLVHVKMFVDLG